MKRIISLAVITALGLGFSGCSTKLLKPIRKKYSDTDKYEYVAIPSTNSKSSSQSSFYVGKYGGGGGSSTKQMNPSSIIEGMLLKKGLTSVDRLSDDILDKTLIVKYGESGRREVGMGGYTLEVTMKIIDAKTIIALQWFKAYVEN